MLSVGFHHSSSFHLLKCCDKLTSFLKCCGLAKNEMFGYVTIVIISFTVLGDVLTETISDIFSGRSS